MDDKWKNNLTPEQKYILKEEGTEPPGSSPLNQEKREGDYICAGCGTKLFNSKIKFLKKRPGERYASALTKMNLSNKVYRYFGKIKLEEYINNFLITNKN